MNNQFQGRQLRSDAIKIKCRGYRIDTHKIPNMTVTLTRAFLKGATVYFSCDEPVAIKYDDGKAIMTFQKLGDITMQNKLRMREFINFVTVMPDVFDGELFSLLSKR